MKITAKEILAKWLQEMKGLTFANYDIERSVPSFGKMRYNIMHSGGTYTRAFRALKDGAEEFKLNSGAIIRRVKVTDKNYDVWHVS